MENEAIVDEILAAVEALMQAAGPEWTLQFLQAGMENLAGEEDVVSQGGPGAMGPVSGLGGRPMPPRRAS